jgi:hypothetical protein
MTLKQLKEKIVQYGFLFVYAKFHGNFFIKTIFFLPFINFQYLLQNPTS